MEAATKIFRSGNSSAVRLNKSIIVAAGLHDNDEVTVTVNKKNGQIIITPAKNKSNVHSNFYDLLDYSTKADQDTLNFLKDK